MVAARDGGMMRCLRGGKSRVVPRLSNGPEAFAHHVLDGTRRKPLLRQASALLNHHLHAQPTRIQVAAKHHSPTLLEAPRRQQAHCRVDQVVEFQIRQAKP